MPHPITAAILAGQAILKIYENDFDVYSKSDSSPLTEADLQAHKVIVAELEKTGIPILSEEGKDIPFSERSKWKQFWMVDPLDGTKEFVKRNGEFTVNIALIEDGRPVFGVIYVPVEKTLYVGEVGKGAVKFVNIHTVDDWKNAEGVALPMPHHRDHLVVVGSRSHMSPETEAFIANLQSLTPPNFPTSKPPNLQTPKPPHILSKGSSLKLCMVAEGTADVYPRFSPTMEWDTAAGDAICRAAGCEVVQYPSMKPMVYNKEELLNSWFVVRRLVV